MPIAALNGTHIPFDVTGDTGDWIALSPGGRRGMDELLPLATRIAEGGYRVLIHDRRNCGAGEVAFDDRAPEFEIWADDLYALLQHVDASPAIVGGFSSGCRLSLLLALKHPEAVRALLLMRITGGAFAAERLARKYYTDYIEMVEQGGMQAIQHDAHFRALIAANPSNAARLAQMDAPTFLRIFRAWRTDLEAGATMPVLGATQAQLRSLAVPTCVIPGTDRTHPIEVGKHVHELIAGSTWIPMDLVQRDADFIPMEAWCDDATLADSLLRFLKTLPAQDRP
ncbi:alpha/beta hydrolase [Pigmentiphaga litoralis]|uniref:alpha/beta fold hydrolase n=1 Tax=Pigmentiphaga litoralis TaxID=516702 RepID=UPI0016761F49|nr:alpha/beta hydrolase [Pigmentiphaga litoralis]GGX11443.1 alpha/beta hydrolase [Pigmentiphaga litoralis]